MSELENTVIHPKTQVEEPSYIGAYCVIGDGWDPSLSLIIGKNANIRSHTVIYFGSRVGSNFTTGHHVLIRNNCEIGSDVSIGTGSVIEHSVKIEDRVRIHSNVFIPEHSCLEADCWIGPNVCFTNAKYPKFPEVKKYLKGPTIKKGARIGANTTILPGIIVGENALIGAGSVVTKDVPDAMVVAGNPARIINKVSNLSYEEYSIK